MVTLKCTEPNCVVKKTGKRFTVTKENQMQAQAALHMHKLRAHRRMGPQAGKSMESVKRTYTKRKQPVQTVAEGIKWCPCCKFPIGILFHLYRETL